MTTGTGDEEKRVRQALPALGVAWLLLAGLIVIVQLAGGPRIEIAWETESEFGTAGFNVWRSDSEDGKYQKVNERLIPGAPDAALGSEYHFVDEQVKRGKTYYYRLEDVDFNNSSALHEIVPASAQGISRAAIGMAFACALIGAILIFSGVLRRTDERENA
jgi:hypothetical protein